MLDAAIKQRPQWAELQVAQGQLALVLDNNVDQALKSFEKAFELGASNLNALALQIRLLAERGRAARGSSAHGTDPDGQLVGGLGEHGRGCADGGRRNRQGFYRG